MADPITLTAPTADQIQAEARRRGVRSSGTFPLGGGARYLMVLARVDSAADADAITTAAGNIAGVQAAFKLGDHVTWADVVGEEINATVTVVVNSHPLPVEEQA